jgi:hypothetical protein
MDIHLTERLLNGSGDAADSQPVLGTDDPFEAFSQERVIIDDYDFLHHSLIKDQGFGGSGNPFPCSRECGFEVNKRLEMNGLLAGNKYKYYTCVNGLGVSLNPVARVQCWFSSRLA